MPPMAEHNDVISDYVNAELQRNTSSALTPRRSSPGQLVLSQGPHLQEMEEDNYRPAIPNNWGWVGGVSMTGLIPKCAPILCLRRQGGAYCSQPGSTCNTTG